MLKLKNCTNGFKNNCHKKINIENIVKKLKTQIESIGITIDKIFLFGSYVKGTSNEYSDIDIAIVSRDFSGVRFYDMEKIIDAVTFPDNRIEIHPFKLSDFNKDNPFANEIIKNGKVIYKK